MQPLVGMTLMSLLIMFMSVFLALNKVLKNSLCGFRTKNQ